MKTFVFTDIVRSVDLKGHMSGRSDAERDAAFVDSVLTPHRERIELGLSDAEGRVVSTAGDGHFLVFANPIQAAEWAIEVQRRHRDRPITTPREDRVEVRMGLHVGFPQTDPRDSHNFIGRVVDYAARLTDLATGGQLLVSTAALGLLRDAGLEGIGFHAHGDRELRGIGPVEVNELLYDSNPPRPLRADKSAPATDVKPIDSGLPPSSDGDETGQRNWTVLPPTMGLTEFARQQGSSAGAAVKPPPLRKLGNYELGALIGAGGMGNVYKARHLQFDRTRAIKIIKPHFVEAGHEEVIRRFYREIKAIGGLDHPNIVVAIDSSSPDAQTHYLVMEYVDGVSSEQLIARRNRLSVANACEIVRQAAVGLEYIHRQGMVHRDVKPSNLMLTDAESSSISAGADGVTRRPVVKILDLGLALLVTEDQPRLTRFDHGAMGTAMYMSPEQWVTTSVDIRADIYSLGCTLFHLLTGKPPFYDSDLRPQRAHERAPTPEAANDTGAPAELDVLLAKMMAKAPKDRFSRPAEVVDALAPFCEGANLLELIDRVRSNDQAATRPGDSGETAPARSMPSDTLGPLPPLPAPPPTAATEMLSAPPATLGRRLLTPVAIVVAIALVLGMGLLVQRQQEQLRRLQADKLLSVAPSSAKELANEINSRFQTLLAASNSPALQQAMVPIAASTGPPPDGGDAPKPSKAERRAWAPLQAWLAEERRQALEKNNLVSSSWFVTDRHGRQVARHPEGDTIGNWYENRDYFHGRGQLAEGEDAPPIRSPHQSAVYRSSSTKLLKVAFSVPIRAEETRDVIGVLAMSVNLGDFGVLEDAEALPAPLEVVLVDMRNDVPKQHGWLLHHRDLRELEDPEDPFMLPTELLAQVDRALEQPKANGSLREPIFRGYPDLLKRAERGAYVGAFEPVVIRGPERQEPTGWMVIVQEEE